jgi:hypothetical protein
MPEIKVNLFSQILKLIDREKINQLVRKHQSNKHSKGINTWTHLVSMLFCHLAKVSSLREISNGLRSATGNLNHLGVEIAPSKSTLSYINQHRNWEVFRDMYFTLLESLEPSLALQRRYATRLRRKIFLMDSTVVSLCQSVFDWAQFRARKGGIKLHTVLDYDNCLPTFLHLTEARKHDSTVAKLVEFPQGSVVVMDRAYLDFDWLYVLDSIGVFFVTRLKSNVLFETVARYEGCKPYQLKDEDIRLLSPKGQRQYPKELRVVRAYDPDKEEDILLLTNNTSWTAQTISELYKSRWEIEVFFKHIKQVLKIKTFVGTSHNAVMIQIWTAMITILILKYLLCKAKYDWSLSNLVGFLRINLMVKINIWHWLNQPFVRPGQPPPQWTLF